MTTDLKDLAELAGRLPATGPRYTSYPTANHFAEGNFVSAYQMQWRPSSQAPISAYIHVPFCATVCYYCACNKIHTANRVHAETYLQHLAREIELQRQVTGRRTLAQIHFGGGTPTTLDLEQMTKVFEHLSASYDLDQSSDRDFSIELDPRKVTAEQVAAMTRLGFNRISVGVQDFDPQVQAAVNRIQSEEETSRVIESARDNGVKSVSIDLIYGLPLQTVAGFEQTLERTLRLNPDRISLYNYAHLPHLFKTQRQIRTEDIPTRDVKLAILMRAIKTLETQGYQYLGMDHFAKSGDSLVRASKNGTLQRNFMGYSTHANCDLLALGVSSIGQTRDLYTQNEKTLNDYYTAIDAGRLPIAKGLQLSQDDQVRRYVIQTLMCTLRLNKRVFESSFQHDFDRYFAAEDPALSELIELGLLINSDRALQVTPMGRFFIRNICMVFDTYLARSEIRFSQTV